MILFKKTLSIMLVLSVILSLFTFTGVSAGGANDTLSFIKGKIGDIRAYATPEQDAALSEIEENYNQLRSLGNDEAPWASVSSTLLTTNILNNSNFDKYIVLELLRNKSFNLSTPDLDISEKINAFKTRNDAFPTEQLEGLPLYQASGKFSSFKSELTEIYGLWSNVLSSANAKNITITFSDNTFYNDTDILNMKKDKIVELVKDINSLAFSSKSTWETAYNNLFSTENIQVIGIIMGESFANCLADEGVIDVMTNYLASDKILDALVKSETTLLDGGHLAAKNEMYKVAATIFDNMLDSDASLAPIKDALSNVGWSATTFTNVLKITPDAADIDAYSRIINMNIIFAMYMDIYANSEVAAQPVPVDGYLSSTEYDIRVKKGTVSASVVNVINANVLGTDNITASTTEGLEFKVKNNQEGDFVLRVYRSGGPESVYGFIKDFNITVQNSGIAAQRITINEGSLTIYINSTSLLTATILPTNTTNKSVTWTSSDPSVVRVTNGLIEGLLVGSAEITAKTINGISDKITVTVKKRPSSSSSSSSSPVGPGTPATVQNDEFTVSVPTGSVVSTTIIKSSCVDPDSVGANDAVSSVYEVSLGSNSPLRTPITVSFDTSDFNTSGEHTICRLDETDGKWKPIENIVIDAVKKTITGSSDSVGKFAVFENKSLIFQDLAGHWSRDIVLDMYNKGYVTGYTEYEFCPDKSMTRAEFATIIYKMLNLTPDEGLVYSDTSSHWAKTYISTVSKLGYMIGYADGEFKPDTNISREQIIAVLMRCKYSGGEKVNDDSIRVNDDELVNIIKQHNPALDPAGVTVSFADTTTVSDWALDYIKISKHIGALNGYEDNTIRPLNFGTRAEAAVFANRCLVESK